MLEHDTRHNQAQLVGLASLADVGNAGPELVHGDVELVDGHHEVGKKAISHLLQAGITAPVVEPGGAGRERSNDVLLDQVGWHVSILPFLRPQITLSGIPIGRLVRMSIHRFRTCQAMRLLTVWTLRSVRSRRKRSR